MYEAIFKDFFDHREKYPQYINPVSGPLDVVAFAKDRAIGNKNGDTWVFPSIVFDPAWNTTQLFFDDVDLEEVQLSGVRFSGCRFNDAYINYNFVLSNVVFDSCQLDTIRLKD